jgi:hypothetical protein
MALDETEMTLIREIAVNSATVVSKEIIENVLKWHIDACPHGKAILASKWVLIGLCLGSGAGGATLFAAISKLF